MGEFAATIFIAKIMMFIGKVAIVATNIFILDALLKPFFNLKVTSMIGPSVIVGLISWIMCSIFFGLFENASDTMVTAHCIDQELYPEEGGKYGPASFHDHMNTIKSAKD
jgi:hypothetical protein